MALLRERSTGRFIADSVRKWSTPPIRKVTTLHQGNWYRRMIKQFLFRTQEVFRAMSARSPQVSSGATQNYSNFILSIIHVLSPHTKVVLYIHHLLYPFNARWLLYVPSVVIPTNFALCPRTVFVCFVRISEQTAIISLCSTDWLFLYPRRSVFTVRYVLSI
jgi:hypothetical protein